MSNITSTPISVDPSGVDDEIVTTAAKRKATGRPRTRFTAVVVLVVAAATLGLLAKPGTSDAASGVSACFKTRTGMVVGPVNTNLELYMGGQWKRVATGSTSARTGCVSFWMSGSYQNYYARIRMAGYASTGDYFYATPGLMALPGGLVGNLGKTNVSCIGMCYGV